MKKTLKRLLICILIFLMINNFFMTNITYAASDSAFEDWLTDILGTVVGLLTWPVRIVALGCGWAIDTLTRNVAYSQGSVVNGVIEPDTFINDGMITPFDIFFNKIALLDVNFFNISTKSTIINNIRNSIAGWYYVMRMIAAAILLCVLIYVGIRMAISTIASDKAAYKKMLVDWVCSLALIFLLQYIILFTFSVNEAFIGALEGINDCKKLSDAMVNIKGVATGVSANAIAATIVFCMLVAQTLGLLISYFNRMLKIAFLIIIAPLITLTYSIDKMGDGKAQALGTWLKEFVYTVLLQTFHCIIYMAFISMALSIFEAGTDERNNLAGAVLAVLCVKFTKEGEKILGKIFKFSDSTSDSSIAAGMMMSAAALKNAGSIGKGTRAALNGAKSFVGNAKTFARTAHVEALAIGSMLHGAKAEDGKRMSFAEAKDKAEADLTNKEADLEEERNARKYGVSTKAKEEDKNSTDKNKKEAYDKAKAYEDKVAAATAANKNAGMSASLAAAKARAQVAKETRAENIKNNPKGMKDKAEHIWKHNKVRGAINEARSFASQSETLKTLGDIGKKTLSAGMGTFMGGAMYGTGKDVFSSFTSGAAVYKGTQEFMKNSTKTLSNDVSQLLQGAGITDIAEAGAKMNDIMQNTDKYENAEKEVEDIFKELEKALDGLSDKDKKELRNSIKNVVNGEMTRHPNATNADIMNKIQNGDTNDAKKIQSIISNHAKLDASGDNSASIKAAYATIGGEGDDSFINFQRNKSIYDTVKNAGNIGVSPDSFIASSLKQFERDSSASQFMDAADRKKVDRDIISNAEEGNITDVGKILEEAKNDPTVIRNLEKRMESELSSLCAQQAKNIEYGGVADSELQDRINNLEKTMNAVSDAALRNQRANFESQHTDLEEQAKTLKEQIETKIKEENAKREEARKTFGKEKEILEVARANLEAERAELERQQREVEALLENVQTNYKASVKEAERFGSEDGIKDAKAGYKAIYG